jgi:HEAT repeat protein
LGHWDYAPIRTIWRQRVAHPDTSGNDLLLAIRGLGDLRDNEAHSTLEKLLLSPSISTPIRLETARVLGELRTSGAEASARRLMADGKEGRLAAAWLLRHHRGPEAIHLLQAMARDTDSLVALVALQCLTEIDRTLVVPFLKDLLANPDPDLRLLAVDVLFHEPTLEHIPLLGVRLRDPHPDVRMKARQSLRELGMKPAWHSAVVEQALRILGEKQWQGLEQAIILLAELDHKAAAQSFVGLLTFERPEVFIAAAWGLRRLAVPQTLPAALAHFDRLQQQLRSIPTQNAKPLPEEALDDQLSQLAQFFGQVRYMTAERTLRLVIPKPPPTFPGRPPRKERALGVQARAAAIWALGSIHDGQAAKDLIALFEGYLSVGFVPGSGPPEDYRVRWMCAISLGRIKAKDALGALKKFYTAGKPSLDPVNNACGWAMEQITGQRMPPPGTVEPPDEGFKSWLRSMDTTSTPGQPK